MIVLANIIEDAKGAIAAFKENGLTFDSLKLLIEGLVRVTEELDSEFFKGKDKKEAVLNILDQIYVESGIDIPFVPQSIERTILRWICSILIDTLVKKLNKIGW